MTVSELMTVLERVAPLGLAEDWDEVGLQVGQSDAAVGRVLLTLDLTEPVLAEAVAAGVQLIVAYHPLMFRPLGRLVEADAKQRIAAELIRRDIACYSPHTALDAAVGGVNDWLCDGLGDGPRKPLSPSSSDSGDIPGGASGVKIVTFVPGADLVAVRDAMFEAGAGVIGAYDRCSFSHSGTGTFRGGADTNPAVGEPGKLETADEHRLEMICRGDRVGHVVDALRRAHPYEEVAVDVLPVQLPADPREPGVGAGRLLTLDEPVGLDVLIERVKGHLGVEGLEVGEPGSATPDTSVRTVAVCPGAGASLLRGWFGRADVVLTGEMSHHDQLACLATGSALILAGHSQTERPYLPVYRDRLIEAGGGSGGGAVRWVISEADRPPTSRR